VLKLLEGANIKLSGVASDVFGVSGMAMLEALAAGAASPSEMAGLARGPMRRKRVALEAALEGRVREHQRFLLAMPLRGLEAIGRDLEALDGRLEAQLEPFRARHRLLMPIPGVDWVTAAIIIAEIGTDMDVFATARRLAAWAGVAPGSYESAGRPKGAAVRRGNVFLKSALFAAAAAAVRTKGSYYRDKYHRLRARRGPVRAARCGRSWPSPTSGSSPPSTCWPPASPSATSARATSTGSPASAPRPGWSQRLSHLGYEVMLVPKAA
jgi:transposase